MAAGMAKERSPKSLSTIKAMKTQTKAGKVNFFRTLEVNQRLKTTQRAFIQEILIVVRTLTFLTCPTLYIPGGGLQFLEGLRRRYLEEKPLRATPNYHPSSTLDAQKIDLGCTIWTSHTAANRMPYFTFFKNLKHVTQSRIQPHRCFVRLHIASQNSNFAKCSSPRAAGLTILYYFPSDPNRQVYVTCLASTPPPEAWGFLIPEQRVTV